MPVSRNKSVVVRKMCNFQGLLPVVFPSFLFYGVTSFWIVSVLVCPCLVLLG